MLSRAVPPLLFSWRFSRMIHRERPQYIVVAFHNPIYSFLTTLAGKVNGGTLVFDIHDSWVYMEVHHEGRFRNMVRKLLESLSIRLATRATTISLSLQDLVARAYRLPVDSIWVVHNGASTPPIIPVVDKDIDIIHVGSPRLPYDTLAFIEALSIVSKSGMRPSVVFLGCEDDSYVEKVKARANALGLSMQIRFLPRVPHAQVGKWMARARVAGSTVPVDSRGGAAMAVKVFEYMAYGLPIVHLGPADGEIARLIRDGNCGIAASTIQEFAEAIMDLLKDKDKRKAMGAKALELAGKHTWEESGRELAAALGIAEGG